MITTYWRTPEGQLEKNVDASRLAEALQAPGGLLWVDIEDLQDEDIELLMNVFKLHDLTVEDIILPNPYPKLEAFETYLFLIAHELKLQEGHGPVALEVDICIGKNFLVTVHSEPLRAIGLNQDRVERRSPVITRGADFLLLTLLDSLVGSGLPVIEELDKRVERLEEELFAAPTRETLNQIYRLRRNLSLFRASIGPERDIVNLLMSGSMPFIQPSNQPYFRNVYDHLVRIYDLTSSSRDILTSAMEAYTAVISNQLNEAIKKLTVIGTITLPSVVVASIYGMNFHHMPELDEVWGYPFALGLMLAASAVLLVYFRRKRWI